MVKYRVWRIANFPAQPTYYSVNTPEEGARLINLLASSDLKNPSIETNVFGMEVLEDGVWSEWYDCDGNDIEAMADELLDKEK